ncbi:pseudaminic acid synthase [Aequorivita viscosa]|uniref:Pseudaminic acid synthase n=1 Tax=Aequorivita viscosa TaxID=797419 RepID=A0A1M6FNN1_9FLAO|nr:pseudaminic acid synthase [Aequorivita viscosa]SDW74983.1 N-acetylneuraminate synthase [Aequorivita viscosa]SHI99275.1 pseudaminic acid synthase [Aequorivita viscosa]
MKNNRTFIIAELSANHNNDLDLALRTVKAAAESGADAIKVQTYTADSLAIDVDNEFFGPKKEGLWKGIRPYDLYTEASLPYDWHKPIQKAAKEHGLIFFSSPFDLEGVDFLETLNVPLYKIASFEITDIPLIEYTASKGKPMIISTGVASEEDINLAVETCRMAGNYDITLLKCTSQYPAKIEDANLSTITDMQQRFNVKIGLSDHTMGDIVPTTAVALGAVVIEKHFILNRNLDGPDSSFSMEPKEFKEMVDKVRLVEASLGEVSYKITEKDIYKRRSLFAVKDIKKGEVFTKENVRSVRPGVGLHTKFYKTLLGERSNREYRKGDPLKKN